jgi:hypothetical protein
MELIGWNVRKKCSSRDGFQPLYPELFIKTKFSWKFNKPIFQEQKPTLYPLPVGEGQTDMPIIRVNQAPH